MTPRISPGLIAKALAGGLLAAGSGGAAASEGLSHRGFLELEHLAGEIGHTFLSGEIWIGHAAAAGPGFDAGLVAFTDFDGSEHMIYAALTWGFGASRLSVGAPRPAYGSFGELPAIGGMQAVRLALMPLHGDLAETAYLLGDADAPLGLRYDGDFGRLRVAASVLRLSGIDADDHALALDYAVTSTLSLRGDWERLSPDGSPDTTASRMGVAAQAGVVSGGVSYFNRDFHGVRPHVDGYETWASYAPRDDTTITLSALNSNAFDLLGLSLRYEPARARSGAARAYGEIGVADGPDFDPTFELSIGLRF